MSQLASLGKAQKSIYRMSRVPFCLSGDKLLSESDKFEYFFTTLTTLAFLSEMAELVKYLKRFCKKVERAFYINSLFSSHIGSNHTNFMH